MVEVKARKKDNPRSPQGAKHRPVSARRQSYHASKIFRIY
jgi:hypothetical protein